MEISGQLLKMRTALAEPINYSLRLGQNQVDLNQFLEQPIRLEYGGIIECVSCGKVTKKSFGQGFCYPCFINSPDNSECIIHPELCKGHLGEGRDPEWEQRNHVQPHYVYLALSSDVKVGVTRSDQIPTRWIDQGASSAIILAETPYRQLAGQIEVFLKNYLPDKTHWMKMLKNEIAHGVDLRERKQAAAELLPQELKAYVTPSDEVMHLHYPVITYPQKVKSLNLDKTPIVEGVLYGIKGQYLIFSDGSVMNIRSMSGHVVKFLS